MKIGVLMPCYNQLPEYLDLAILSICQQVRKPDKFLVLIDGADEETCKRIKEWRVFYNFDVIHRKENKGLPYTLNEGFEILRKEVDYMTWVSSDNVYFPNFLMELEFAVLKEKADIIFGGFDFSSLDVNNPVNGLVSRCVCPQWNGLAVNDYNYWVFNGDWISICFLVKADKFVPFKLEHELYEDLVWVFSYAENQSTFSYVPKSLVYYQAGTVMSLSNMMIRKSIRMIDTYGGMAKFLNTKWLEWKSKNLFKKPIGKIYHESDVFYRKMDFYTNPFMLTDLGKELCKAEYITPVLGTPDLVITCMQNGWFNFIILRFGELNPFVYE